eukprot:jgi/Pico_ML_1/52397/g3106.t1
MRTCLKRPHVGPARTPNVRRMASARVRVRAGHDVEGSESSQEAHVDASTDELDVLATAKAFLGPAIGGALFGYDIGATSGALVSLQTAATSATLWGPQLTDGQKGWLVSASLAGCVLGAVLALTKGDEIGRRKELLFAAASFALGSIFSSQSGSLGALAASRMAYGVGEGLVAHAAPAYIAETAPTKARGTLVSLKEAFIVGGILAGFVVSRMFADMEGGWRWIYGVAVLPAGVLGLLMYSLPPSPRWLLMRGRGRDEAKVALLQLRGRVPETQVEDELLLMEESALPTGKLTLDSILDLFRGRNRKVLFVGGQLMIWQQITGQPSVLYYAAQILQKAGFSAASEATGATVVIGAFKLLMTMVAVFTVDKVGRRPLLLAGISGMVVALFMLASTQGDATGPMDDPSWMGIVSVIALLMYVGCYQVSFGPIAWLLVGEVFPNSIRGSAIAVATLANFGSNFLVTLSLPLVQGSLGESGTYTLFAALGIASLISVYFTVPETKGLSLEEIEKQI